MARWGDMVRVEVGLEPDLHAELAELVGSRGMSPTIRELVQGFVEQERVRRRIEALRERSN